jgi:hypothetical protein
MALADVTYYWKLDEVSGTRVASVGGQNLSVYDTASWDNAVEGKVGRCKNGNNRWNANGNGFGLYTDKIARIAGSFSCNFWLRGPQTFSGYLISHCPLLGQWRYIDSGGARGGSFYFYYDNSLWTLYFATMDQSGVYHEGGTSQAIVTPMVGNKWSMWTLTYDSSTKAKQVFVNTVSAYSGTATHSNALGYYSTCRFVAGLCTTDDLAQTIPSSAKPYYPPVDLDEVGIWDGYVLTAADIATLYNNSAGLTYPFFDGKAMKFRS